MKQRQESINEVHPPMSSDPPISRLIIFLSFYLVAAENFFVASSDLVDSLIDHSLFGFLGHLRRARRVFRHRHKNKTTNNKVNFSIGKACGVARKQHKPLAIGWMSCCRILSTIPSGSVSGRRCIPSGCGDEKTMSASTEHHAGFESEVNQLLTNLQVTNDPLKSNQSCLLVTAFPPAQGRLDSTTSNRLALPWYLQGEIHHSSVVCIQSPNQSAIKSPPKKPRAGHLPRTFRYQTRIRSNSAALLSISAGFKLKITSQQQRFRP